MSMGFHTFTIFKKITYDEARLLYRDFEKYEAVKIYPIDKYEEYSDIRSFDKWLHSSSSQSCAINCYDRHKGISWILRFSKTALGYNDDPKATARTCSIKARINPKIFAGIKDYITVADEGLLGAVEAAFNLEARKISQILGEFDSYDLNRIDYCINFDLKELDINCTPEQMMKLIKRSNIPNTFTEWTAYDEKSHRKVTGKNSFYLKNNSVNINCYHKHYQLQREFSDCPDMENALDIIRFEIQCKYLKVYSMAQIIKNKSRHFTLLNEMLSDEVSRDIISRYFDKVVLRGDYYTIEKARRIIQSHNFSRKKEQRIIDSLELINGLRGIARAKATFQGQAVEDFRRTLRELTDININPVTIPKEWVIKGSRIHNLLDAYYRKLENEQSKERLEKAGVEMVDECLTENRRKLQCK